MTQKQSPNVAMRLSDSDKAKLEELARRMVTSQTDMIRVLVRGAYASMIAELREPTQQGPAATL